MSYPDVATSGQLVQWESWDRAFTTDVTIRWENHGWVAQGRATRERVDVVVRMNAAWKMSQFLLFRDLPEPDLWLGTDGSGRWGEINGAHRPELDGCLDVELACTPFTSTLPIRRLGLVDGFAAEIVVAVVDVDTLQVTAQRREYTRLSADAWTCRDTHTGELTELAVDEFGLVRDVPGRWRRLPEAQ